MKTASNGASTGATRVSLPWLLAGLQSVGMLLVLAGIPTATAPVVAPTEVRAATLTWEDVNSDTTLANYVAAFRERFAQQPSTLEFPNATPDWLSGAEVLFPQHLRKAASASTAETRFDCVQVELPPEPSAKRKVFSLFGQFNQHPLKHLNWCFTGHWDGTTLASSKRPTIRFTPIPRAYAKAGDIYLPAAASVDLLAHELAHIAGLADEYAMRTELATPFCEGRYRHPSLNVVVTQRQIMTSVELQQLWQRLPWRSAVADWRLLGTRVSQQGESYWRLGSSAATSVGLFAVATCTEVGKFAWRPVPQTTAMQHFDVPHWPALYLQLMQRYLAEQSSR